MANILFMYCLMVLNILLFKLVARWLMGYTVVLEYVLVLLLFAVSLP